MRAAAAAVVAAAMVLVLSACTDGDSPIVSAPTSAPVATTPTGPTTAGPTTTGPTTTAAPTANVTTTAGAAVTSDCATVGFTPNSEDAASSVKATGLPCAEAEAFVRIAGTRTSSGGPPVVDVEGYHCVATRMVEDPLPAASYTCTNGSKTVTFVRS